MERIISLLFIFFATAFCNAQFSGTFADIPQMKGQAGVHGVTYNVASMPAPNNGMAAEFLYDSTSTATPDDYRIVKPNGISGSGRYRMISMAYPKDSITSWINSASAVLSTLIGTKLDASQFSWANLPGKPTYATVATTGNYNDLNGKPTLFTGNYNDLSNKPTIPVINNASVLAAIGFTPANSTALSDYYTKPQADARYLQVAPVTSVNGQTGAVTLTIPTVNNASVLAAIGYTPANPANYYDKATSDARFAAPNYIRFFNQTLPLIGIGSTVTVSVTFPTAVPNTNYSIQAVPLGAVSLLGALQYQGIVSGTQTTTGCTLQFKNNGISVLTAGGVAQVMVIGIP
jgi:hypothetical protein